MYMYICMYIYIYIYLHIYIYIYICTYVSHFKIGRLIIEEHCGRSAITFNKQTSSYVDRLFFITGPIIFTSSIRQIIITTKPFSQIKYRIDPMLTLNFSHVSRRTYMKKMNRYRFPLLRSYQTNSSRKSAKMCNNTSYNHSKLRK
jgi:hypothetical protein